MENYRPISILPFLSKVFEKVLLKQLVTHFESNNLLCPNQFGFRKKKSTTQAIYSLLDAVYEAFKKKMPYACILIFVKPSTS